MRPYFESDELVLYCGDALDVLRVFADDTVQCSLSSPPYWALKDYGVEGQLGREPTPGEFVAKITDRYAEVRRVLRRDGVCWINLGDSFITNPGNGRGGERVDGGTPERSAMNKTAAGLHAKNLVGIPWRTALALQDDGWILRADVVWEKPNVKPDGAKDRPTISHEYVFMLAKASRYYYDAAAIAEDAKGGGTRNRRSVWRLPTHPFPGAHFACWPKRLAEMMIAATTREGDVVLDPFFGAGTTALAARDLGRRVIGIEINRKYCDLALERLGYR